MTFAGFAHAVSAARGWRRALIAFLAGVVSALAVAPTNAWPLLFLTFPVLVWLIDGSAGRWGGVWRAAATGWWFGFGYLLLGLYWVGHAFLVDAQTFGWLMPFAVLALPAAFAIYFAVGVALARLVWTPGPARILALAAALTASEWLRGHLFTGFPWNALGYTITTPFALAQGAALVGLWGMTIVAVAVFASPATLADVPSDGRRRWLSLVIAVAVLGAIAVYGTLRLLHTPTTFVDGVQLRIMQPNLQQDEKFDYSAKDQVMQHYLDLSRRVVDGRDLRGVTHLIWPESAFPFYLAREPSALAQIGALLPQGAVLITGSDRVVQSGSEVKGLYNSIYVVDHRGSVLAVYDKVHLVPFGEFLPFQGFLERLGLMQLTKVSGGFLSGEEHRPIAVPPAPPMLPLLCYEIIFPNEAVPRDNRPGWLINLTNDGWFGISTGPYQHLQQARVRAIEEGLPLVRAANTGVSAVIDPVGRTIASLPLGTEGVLDAQLPRAIPPTFYTRYGDVPAIILVALGFAAAVFSRFHNRAARVTQSD